MTTWIKCADQMPPDEGNVIFHNGHEIKPTYIISTGFLVRCRFSSFIAEYGEWTPYSPELWKELNK